MSRVKIGIVLASVPGYSETFFRSKINGLTAQGFQIFLFAKGRSEEHLLCKIINPYPVYQNPLLRSLMAVAVSTVTFIRRPANVVRFYNQEKASGSTMLQFFRRLYINAHILPYELDWLHFGFATTMIERETVAKSIGAKMAVSFRGYDINVYPLRHPSCYEKCWKYVDKIHSISKYLLDKAHLSLKLPHNATSQIITPAVEFSGDVKNRETLDGTIRLMTIARLHWIKGLEYGIRAAQVLKSQGVQLCYTIIGEGPEHEKLRFEIHQLGLENEIVLVGKLSHEQVISKFQECDIYLQPSLNEGFCNAVLEAQAYGCLCVVSDAGALPENIVHGVTGWLVPPRNAQALADTVLHIKDLKPSDRKRVAVQARERVHKSFMKEDYLKAWKKFYESER